MSDFERAMEAVRSRVDVSDITTRTALGELDLAYAAAVEAWMEEIRQLRGEVELGRQARQQLGMLRAELAACRTQVQTVLDRESRAYGNGHLGTLRRLEQWAAEQKARVHSELAQLPEPDLTVLTAGTDICTCIRTEQAPDHRNSNSACRLTRAKRRAEGTVMT